VVRARLLAFLAASALAGVLSAPAAAETIVERDAAGRAITFDVQATGVDVEWYAGLLRRAAHGDEISTVTIRIVPAEEMHERCGHAASACYTGRGSPTVTVPAGKSPRIASVVLHEYAHHLDRAWEVEGQREPNGTPAWWALRGMSELVQTGAVSGGYRLGWNRGIGEVFAEDYAYIHLRGQYGIRWLYPPSRKLEETLLAELRGTLETTPAPASAAVMTRPLTITDSGTIAPGESRETPFRLLGPGRRVTFTAAVSGAAPAPVARAAVVCDGRVVKSTRLVSGRQTTLDVPRLGPAACSASLVSTSASPRRFSLRLRLAIEARRQR
jgi:hypothetical protein